MAIRFNQYVDIVSGVGAGTVVTRREFMLRLFTNNLLLPYDQVLEFSSADDVGTYFGTSSQEYLRALAYFSFISKNITRPKTISFSRWVDTNVAPRIYGNKTAKVLSTFTAISNGAFSLTMGGTTNIISGLDFSAAGNLAAIATIIQTAIQTKTGTMWTAATVSYDAVRGSFNLVGGSAIASTISVAPPGTGTDISQLIGWYPQGTSSSAAIWASGKLTESLTEALERSVDDSTNFGVLVFIPALAIEQIIEVAAWNKTQNNQYQYQIPVLKANASTYQAQLVSYGGTGLNISEISGEYPEQVPAMILAATDYSARNSTQNYMFQQANLTPSVTSTDEAIEFDGLGINYYGQTQVNGQQLAFYQRGILMGLATDPLDMNTYANEQWLKDAIGTAIMELLLNLSKVSANIRGRAQLMAASQPVLDQALLNGVFSVGKPLTNTQILYINEITGDDTAWYQVQNIGYWINWVVIPTENLAKYTLVYSKDDVVRKVEGTDVLI